MVCFCEDGLYYVHFSKLTKVRWRIGHSNLPLNTPLVPPSIFHSPLFITIPLYSGDLSKNLIICHIWELLVISGNASLGLLPRLENLKLSQIASFVSKASLYSRLIDLHTYLLTLNLSYFNHLP